MHNGKFQCHMAASCTYHLHTTYQLSSPSCSTRATQKSLILKGKIFENFLEKKVRRLNRQQKDEKIERAKGQRKKARKVRKWASNDSPEIPDREVDIRLPQPPSPSSNKITWKNTEAGSTACSVSHMFAMNLNFTSLNCMNRRDPTR